MNRPTGIRRTHRTATTLATLSLPLALLTACGSSGDSGSDSAAVKETAVGAKPLTAAQLDAVSLAKSDLTGDLKGYIVRAQSKAELADGAKTVAEDDACTSVGRVLGGGALDEPADLAGRRVTAKADRSAVDPDADAEELALAAFNVTTTSVALAAYDTQAAAEAALASLGDAVDACGGGFAFTVAGEQWTVNQVTTDTAPEAGQDAVALTAVTKQSADSAGPVKAVVFRQGSTLAHFVSFNAASMVTQDDFAFPTALVTTQATKLG
ncbi:hypothetical protein OK074_4725 [Actinobacteria bacterium OK074]|nr:hypothetical protein OK074_4725 [Actinobacteria bacterium OK074]